MEMMPKYEMVTYYKGNTIPNSHIHMYDPDNVTVACGIFRVSFDKSLYKNYHEILNLKNSRSNFFSGSV